ncbi:MAG: hypothetical protein QXO40_04490 [Candidatus Aenigmatarchaeota archaeon]
MPSTSKNPEIENGAWFAEFELIKPIDIKYELKDINNYQTIVLEGESESSSGSKGYRQLESYLESGYFNFGMLVCPGRIGDEKYYSNYGYITWDNEGEEYRYFPNEDYSKKDKLNEMISITLKLIKKVSI